MPYVLQTAYVTPNLPMLPDRCPHCNGGIVIDADTAEGDASGRCARMCGWTFGRLVLTHGKG